MQFVYYKLIEIRSAKHHRLKLYESSPVGPNLSSHIYILSTPLLGQKAYGPLPLYSHDRQCQAVNLHQLVKRQALD